MSSLTTQHWYDLDNEIGGFGELEFFGNLNMESVYELDNDIIRIGELDFLHKPGFDRL
jgi:hypothetical protein